MNRIVTIALVAPAAVSIPLMSCGTHASSLNDEDINREIEEVAELPKFQAQKQADAELLEPRSVELTEEQIEATERSVYKASVHEVSGIIEVTTIGERAKEAVAQEPSEDLKETKIALLHLDNAEMLCAREDCDDHPLINRFVSVLRLPESYINQTFDGKRLSITAGEWGLWPNDDNALLWDLDVSDLEQMTIKEINS